MHWLENMNKAQELYIEEIEKANKTLREQMQSRESVLNSPFVQEVIKESLKMENRSAYYNGAGSGATEKRPPFVAPNGQGNYQQ